MEQRDEIEHTNIPSECEKLLIQELAELVEHEYYLIGLGLGLGLVDDINQDRRRERAAMGHSRMLETITRMREILGHLKCKACLLDLSEQLQLQTRGLREIEGAWGLER